MPITNFNMLPDSARVWVYGSEPALNEEQTKEMLDEVDRFLHGWKAHGVPLHSGRDWADDRFLTIGVDQEQAKILRLLRCDQMQGYLISKPLSFDEMTAYLARTRT